MDYFRNIRTGVALIFMAVLGWSASADVVAHVSGEAASRPAIFDLRVSADTQSALMSLAYPGARYVADSDFVSILDGRRKAPAWLIEGRRTAANIDDGSPSGRLISILTAFKTDSGDVALIAAEVPTDVEGRASVSHATKVDVGVAVFHVADGHWDLRSRREGVTQIGFFGALQSASVTRVSSSAYAVSLVSGSCWQGDCGEWLSVVGVSESDVELWIDGLRLSADDLDSGVDWNQNVGCGDTLNHPEKYGGIGVTVDPPKRGEPIPVLNLPENRRSCFRVSGHFTFDPVKSLSTSEHSDLKIVFQGKWSIVDTDTLATTSPHFLKLVATYRLKDGKYRLVSGYDPVPMF